MSPGAPRHRQSTTRTHTRGRSVTFLRPISNEGTQKYSLSRIRLLRPPTQRKGTRQRKELRTFSIGGGATLWPRDPCCFFCGPPLSSSSIFDLSTTGTVKQQQQQTHSRQAGRQAVHGHHHRRRTLSLHFGPQPDRATSVSSSAVAVYLLSSPSFFFSSLPFSGQYQRSWGEKIPMQVSFVFDSHARRIRQRSRQPLCARDREPIPIQPFRRHLYTPSMFRSRSHKQHVSIRFYHIAHERGGLT